MVLTVDNESECAIERDVVEEVVGFKVIRLSIVTVIKLPASTNSVTQPMDQGIIHHLKLD